jgi:hypothetical protein
MAPSNGYAGNLQDLARALGGEVSNGQVLAPGPGHSAKDRSLSVKLDANAPDGFVIHSFANDDPIASKDYVREKAGLPAFKPNGKHSKPKPVLDTNAAPKANIVATYPYTDAVGTLLYEVMRYKPKTFRQRRPDGKGGWIWSVKDCRRVPYLLSDLLKHPDATVFVCEGEKDVDRVASLGQCATTVACGDWTEDCVKALAGRDALILEDNDEAGHKKALEAAKALHGTAKTVRIVRLPDLPEKGDVSDWLDADAHNAERLVDVCFGAPIWSPDTTTPATPSKIIWLDMSKWDDEPVPERKWAILNRVPLNQAGLFSGEGGTGKSIIELTKDVAHVSTSVLKMRRTKSVAASQLSPNTTM